MNEVRPIPKLRRGFSWLPLDFSRRTPTPKTWRWMAALCLAASVVPVALALPLGWLFALRVMAVCALGAYKPQGLAGRLALVTIDFVFLLWWMFGGYPQSPPELALAVFVLGVSFKAMELRTVGDGYMASTMSFLGPFLAIIQHLPGWISLLSCVAVPLSLILRSGMSCIESGQAPGLPWKKKHWSAVVGMLGMALPVALAMFWVLPRLPSPYFGMSHGQQGGIPDTMEPGSMDRLMQNPAQAFLVDFKGKAPPSSQIYWRAFSMSSFNGRTWSQLGMPPDTEGAPVVAPLVKTYAYNMTLLPVAGAYLPLLDRPVSVAGDRTVSTASMTYRSVDDESHIRQFAAVGAPQASLDAGVLSPVVRRANLSLPDGYNPRTRALMQSWRRQGYEGERLILHTLSYFRDNMTYSYTPPLLGRNSVDELMFDTREGYCEHFSSSFVFAMRASGIPARVVAGYQGGRPTQSGSWEVRQLDAHAWAEVWLERKGWVRVDPTFAVVRKRPPPPGDAESSGFTLDAPWIGWVQDKASSWFGGFDQKRQQDLFSKWKSDGWSKWLIALGVGVVIMAWGFSALLIGWRSDRIAREVVQWDKFQRQATGLVGMGKSATPRQIRQALSSRLSTEDWIVAKDVLDRWENWRYADAHDPYLARDIAAARKRLRQRA